MLFLHGILGSRSNWRGFARKLVARRPNWGAVLVDLRMHGDSQGFAAPHTVDACARDLAALSRDLGRPVDGVLGHSFGGKVALAFAGVRDDLREVWMIDSMPGIRPNVAEPGSPMRIIELLRGMPRDYDGREQFVTALAGAGIDSGVARWLAMNLVAEGDRYRLRLELDAIRALLDDYLERDDWPATEALGSSTHLHLVVAGRSPVWSAEDLRRAEGQASPGRLTVHRMPDVGHWVHVEDPAGLLSVLAPQ
jgi:pimeloyl-ACP methyl ester carboxylesterase